MIETNPGCVDQAVFVIGVPRSGTSAIGEVVSLHREVGWISNWLTAFPRQYWLSGLNRVAAVPLLGHRLRGKKRQGRGVLDHVRSYLPHSCESFPVWKTLCGDDFLFDYLLDRTASDEERRRVVSAIERILRWQGRRRFFAKFTGPPRIAFLDSLFREPRYIHIVRDPRAVVSSLLHVNFWRRDGMSRPWWTNGLPDEYLQEWTESGRSPAVLAAVQWKRIIEVARREQAAAGADRYLEIRYEDFAAEPHRWLSAIAAFAGLSESNAAHAYLDAAGRLENMNFKFRSRLSRDDIALVERATGELAGKLGYHF